MMAGCKYHLEKLPSLLFSRYMKISSPGEFIFDFIAFYRAGALPSLYYCLVVGRRSAQQFIIDARASECHRLNTQNAAFGVMILYWH